MSLAHRQTAAALPNLAVDAIRQRLQPLAAADLARCSLDVRVARLRAGVADVVGHCSGEEEWHLGDDAQLAAVGGQVKAANVLAINANFALLKLVEASDELDDARLARASVAYKGHALARLNVEAEVVEHLFL